MAKLYVEVERGAGQIRSGEKRRAPEQKAGTIPKIRALEQKSRGYTQNSATFQNTNLSHF